MAEEGLTIDFSGYDCEIEGHLWSIPTKEFSHMCFGCGIVEPLPPEEQQMLQDVISVLVNSWEQHDGT